MAQPKEENKMNIDHINNDQNDYDPSNAEKMFETYMKRVDKFEKTICRFPLETNSIILGGFDSKQIYKNMTQTYPICHGAVLSVAHQFLLAKRQFGSSVEQKLYKNMTLLEFFHRICTKRAVVFYQKYDSFMLRNGKKGANSWEAVGKDYENIDGNASGATPMLADYLSYDELLISALCGISSPTHFINNGNRRNNGRKDMDKNKYPFCGMYMGLIGARFEKQYMMEYALMIISAAQNKEDMGYGRYKRAVNKNLNRLQKAINDEYFIDQIKASKDTFKGEKKPVIRNIFETFYSRDYFPLYDEVKHVYAGNVDDADTQKVQQRYFEDNRRYGDSKPFLDVEMFRRRIRISLELFLFDSDRRCAKVDRKAFCHLVGLGSGYWSFNKIKQDQEMVEVVLSIINESDLANIECIYFSWFDETCIGVSQLNKNENEYYALDVNHKKIILEFGDRDPADILTKMYSKCLLCACYAWDSNAFPGNEYWLGSLNASGDPAAASCSTISYLQNCEINVEYVNGGNTMFYFFNEHNGKYEFVRLRDIDFEKNKQKWLTKSVLSIPYKRKKLIKANDDNNYNDNEEKSNKSNL